MKHFGEAWRILFSTTPYLFLMIMINGLIGLGIVVYLVFLFFMAQIFGGIGLIIFAIGLLCLWGLIKLAQRYLLYIVKAGHIAVITELVLRGSLPANVGQVEHGRETVMRMFKEVSMLFAVDQLVTATIKSVNSMVTRFANMLPIPGADSIGKIAGMVVHFSVTYVDEAILSYNLARKDEGIWESAKRGVVLYAQNWKAVLGNALFLTVLNFIGLVLFVLMMLVPFGFFALMTPSDLFKVFWLFCALALGYGLKLSIINPLCMIITILTYHRAIQGHEPDMGWERELEQYSEKFRQIKANALGG